MYYTYPCLIEGADSGFVRAADGSLVSVQNDQYLAWLAEGNTPEEWNPDGTL